MPPTSGHARGSNNLILQLSFCAVANSPAAAPSGSLHRPRCCSNSYTCHVLDSIQRQEQVTTAREEPITAPSLTLNCLLLLPLNYRPTLLLDGVCLYLSISQHGHSHREETNIDKVSPHRLVSKTALKGQCWPKGELRTSVQLAQPNTAMVRENSACPGSGPRYHPLAWKHDTVRSMQCKSQCCRSAGWEDVSAGCWVGRSAPTPLPSLLFACINVSASTDSLYPSHAISRQPTLGSLCRR